MFCSNCGKEMENGLAFCPQCGASQRPATPSAPNAMKQKYNLMCIVGIVISGISLLLNFWGIVGIAGTIVSVIGLVNCRQNNESGKGLAIAGISIGVFSILYGLISLLVYSTMTSMLGNLESSQMKQWIDIIAFFVELLS